MATPQRKPSQTWRDIPPSGPPKPPPPPPRPGLGAWFLIIALAVCAGNLAADYISGFIAYKAFQNQMRR